MPLKLSNEVQRQLEAINLESLASKLEALGVRSLQDLALVDDADLVRWGLSTIERRRFFGHVRSVLGDSGSDVLTPPSALTTTPVPGRDKAAGARSRRPESTTSSAGPARLDELVGRGSAEYQVPRLAERLLASTGPIDISELALRVSRTAPALAQGYAADEWPQFIEACVRGYKRLQVEDGVLEGDRAIVSICSTVLFTASEEVVADTVCWARIVTCLATPAQVAVVTCLCRGSREVADGPQVWGKLLTRWYPKATLLNPDWVAQTDLEKRLEEALENDYALTALTKRLDPDTALDIGDLMRALPQATTPKALVKFMSGHPEHFRQSPDGKKFCVSRTPDDLRNCKDWRTVNPFQMPPMPKKLLDGEGDSNGSARRGGGAPPAPSPYGRPKELKLQQAQNAPPSGGSAVDTPEVKQEVCQQLDPKVAFRLYHTGLLSQRSDHSKRGKLEAWEYYTESNSKCTMAAGDLLDLAESRVRAIRSNDPAVVHELVCQTIEGMVFKVPFGFWHRRVRVLTMGLSASQLRIGREQRKKLERKLLEFMEWVKKERGFGYYQCDLCKSRWKSGFSYEEITQQCLQCGNWQRPYRIQDLESAQEREAREKGGEDVPQEGRGPLPGKPTNNRFGHGGAVNMHMVPAVMFEPPMLEHSRDNRGQKRAWPGQPSQQPWQRPRYEGRSDTSGGDSWASSFTPHVPRHVPPLRQAREVPALAAAAPPTTSSTSADSGGGARYTPGGGGFFSRSGAVSSSAASTAPARGDAGNAASAESATSSGRYTPGGGGFFSQRSASAGAQSSEDQRPRVDTAAAARIVQHSISAAAASTSPAASSSALPPSSDVKYKPGGGGFFASRQAATPQASAPVQSRPSQETDEDGVFAKARDAANSLLASLGALLPPEVPPAASPAFTESAGAVKRGGILKSSREPAAKAAAETAPAQSAPAASSGSSHDGAAEVAASLGLSVEEAQALGLLGSTEDKAAKPTAAQAAVPAQAAPPRPANPSPPAQSTPPTQPAEGAATSYKPGGGGFFAQRRGGSSSSSSSSSAAAAAASNANQASASASTAPSASGTAPSPSGTAGGAGNAESPVPSEQATSRYRPGGGGFFASRSASSTSSATAGAEAGTAVAASSAAAAQSEGAARAEPSTPARAAASYKPGGGGFFANRRGGGNSSSSTATDAGPASRSATHAAAASTAAPSSAEASPSSRSATDAAAASTAAPSSAEAPASSSASAAAAAAGAVATPADLAPEPPKMEPAAATAAAAAKTAPATAAPTTGNAVAGVSGKAPAAPSPAATAAEPVSKASTESAAASSAPAETAEKPAATSARYKPGAGGFFARKSSGASEEASKAPSVAAPEEKPKEAQPAKVPAPPAATEATPSTAPAAASSPSAATEATPSAASAAAPSPSPPPLPADKLLALQTLGLTLDEAVKMGIVPASYAEASPSPAAASSSSQAASAAATPAAAPGPPAAAPAPAPVAASSTSSEAGKGDADMADAGENAEERAAKRRREEELVQEDIVRQDEIRRREAAAKYAAARRAQSGEAASASGGSTAAGPAAEMPSRTSAVNEARASDAEMAVDQEGEALSVDYAAIASGSDEALVEAVNAVVTFTGTGENAGSTRVIAAQASDVAYLLSDDVFWPLLRRLVAETLALEAGAGDLEAAWVAAPASSEAAVKHAESRGYCLPGGSVAAAVNSAWRHALLTEVATELMLLRLRGGRGFDLPALAGPVAGDNSNWEERPAESLEGVASKVQGATGEGLAQNIIGDLERTALRGAGISAGKPLAERLADVSDSILEQQSRWAAPADSAKNGPALRCKWTLLQEMSVREAAAALRREYGVRRQILLRRLDVTVEALRACDKMTQPATQRKFSDILSRMWAGWRRSAAEAPPLSEWSALAAARGMLTRAMSARVSGPGARVSSAVKKVTIGHVPDRGGVPDGYVKDGGNQAASSTSSAPAPKAKAAAQGQRPRLARTLRGGNAPGDAASSSTAGQPEAAAQAAPATDSAAGRAQASVGVKPRDKKGDGKGGTQVGARSTNKDLKHQHHAQMKKEREEGRSNTYYAELGQLRYGNQGE